MNPIEARLQEMRDEARNELITRIAVHEAGHFVMMLLLTRRAPYHVILTPETGTGMTVPLHIPDFGAERGLIMMAGYAAEKLYDSPEKDTSLGDYMLHDDYDNQDFLNMCRNLTGKESLTENSYVFELKSFQVAWGILKEHQSLIFSLANEIKNAEGTELDYDAIRKFCREHRRAFPVLGGIEFPVPTQKEKKELRQAIEDYRTEQKAAIREDAEDRTCGMR